MEKIILLLFGIFLLLTGPQEVSAFLYFRPPKPPIPPRPTIVIPTWKPIKWFIKPIKSPKVTPTATPSLTPTPTKQPTGGMLMLELVNPVNILHVGNEFTVKILINTQSQSVINADALIDYDISKLEIKNVSSGNFFTYFFATQLSNPNKYLVSGWEESVAYAKSSTAHTLFATVNLTAKGAGTTNLSFDCTQGNDADTNINRSADSLDIINCSSLIPLTIQIVE